MALLIELYAFCFVGQLLLDKVILVNFQINKMLKDQVCHFHSNAVFNSAVLSDWYRLMGDEKMKQTLQILFTNSLSNFSLQSI